MKKIFLILKWLLTLLLLLFLLAILADTIIYTENKTVIESRDEILALFECMISKEKRS